MALLSPRLWLALALAAVLAFTHGLAYRTGRAHVQVIRAAEQLEYANKLAQGEAAARVAERTAQAAADKLRGAKNVEIARVSRERDAALDGLRQRPNRPADYVPQAPGTGNSCTGAELFRGDAEFLIREAARADELRAALEQCQAQYGALNDLPH